MIIIERIEVSGLANALYGMRLPKKSHNKADTYCLVYDSGSGIKIKHINRITSDDIVIKTEIGTKDKELASTLVLAGTDHGKWLRQVQISLLITAPMTFWWDFDTYKVATVKNSSSRMHKITNTKLDNNDFSWDNEDGVVVLSHFREMQLIHLNALIDEYNMTDTTNDRKKILFREIIQDLPDSYNFSAVWTGSAQTCRNYYFARKNHKQMELRILAEIFSNLREVGYFIKLTNMSKCFKM